MRAPLLLSLVFIVLTLAGLGVYAAAGTPVNHSATTNVIMIVAGAATAAAGIWLVRKPTGLTMSSNQGTDAFGMQQYGASRSATGAELVRNGLVFTVVGVLFLIMGIFMGAITG